MLSMVAATALMTGLTGCGGSSDTNNVSTTEAPSAVVNTNEQAKYTAPIQGVVIDDRGQFVAGATVTIGNQTTTTDESGQYRFDSVDISSFVINEINQGETSESDSSLLVSIKAPAGSDMNDVVVAVSPSMVHIADGTNDPFGNDGAEVQVTGDQNVLANSQSFVINSQVGTAMLAHKAADVVFTLRNPNTGVPVPEGTKVVAMYLGTTGNLNNASQTINNNLITSVNSVVAYTDANGVVKFENLLTSSKYEFRVEGYNSNATVVAATQTYAGDEYTMDLGNQTVTPIVSNDTIPPLVKSVAHDFGVTGTRLMLDNTVTNTITINFTEPVEADDIANNVKVISNGAFLEVASATIEGNQLIVTLANPLASGQEFDLLVFRESRLRDLAGNELAFVGATSVDAKDDKPFVDLASCVNGCQSSKFAYLSCTMGSRAIQFSLMAYKVLSEDATPATDGVQMALDDDINRTASSNLSDLEEYSNAFNNVGADDNVIVQLNNVAGSDAQARLTQLAQELLESTDVTIDDISTAKIKFVAGNASSYEITVPRNSTCSTDNANITVTNAGCNGSQPAGGPKVWTVSGFKEGDEIALLISDVEDGDKVVITPKNDYCLSGDVTSEIVLHDNVAPTTVLQNSYVGGDIVGGRAAVVPFGEGGELTNGYTNNVGLGVPSLYITPGALDNLDKNGNNILGANNHVQGDETLYRELYIHNYADNNYTGESVYDATDYKKFATMLSRDIGVAFSEDVSLEGVTPSFAGASVTGYKVVNNVTVDDAGNQVSKDLAAFTTNDILTLANAESNAIMSFNGIKDLAGNAADSANVKILDGMPPFVTKAIFDGEKVVVTFNEKIALRNGVEVALIAADGTPKGATYNETETPAKWTLDTTGTVLTIDASEFDGGLTAADFSSEHNYDESADYGLDAGKYKHAEFIFDEIRDVRGNYWEDWCKSEVDDDESDQTVDLVACGDDPLRFAMISNIGDFTVAVDNSEFVETNTTGTHEKIVWTFNQAIETNSTELFDAGDGESDEVTEAAKINEWFDYNSTDLTVAMDNVKITLDDAHKVMTMTFDSNGTNQGDSVSTKDGQFFTSHIDPDQTESVSASANGSN
jgi:hypothetical protein